MTQPGPWRVSGSYFEVCSCEAICPCRMQGGKRRTTGSTYGDCDFALSWHILNGTFAGIDVSDRFVIMAGKYSDSEPNRPVRIPVAVRLLIAGGVRKNVSGESLS